MKTNRKVLNQLLTKYATRYETADFILTDPSRFMHEVNGQHNQEAIAFIASCLSYGNRKQFMPKIQQIIDYAHGNIDAWIRQGLFEKDLPQNTSQCFYRLYTVGHLLNFLRAYQHLLITKGSLRQYIQASTSNGYDAIIMICNYFKPYDIGTMIPKDTNSACKRVCMFLRWMVRDNSPVDLGLWAFFMDKRTLIMPLDTHVIQQANRLSLLTSKTASMNAARKLTAILAETFPDDPLKGDFALYGYDINQ